MDRINGVNQGWPCVIEPFIDPQLSGQLGMVDERSLSVALSENLLDPTEDRYDTFVAAEDIVQIAGAGLNLIWSPVPFWATGEWDGVGVDGNGATVSGPFSARTCWK